MPEAIPKLGVRVRAVLEDEYANAEKLVNEGRLDREINDLGQLGAEASKLGATKHHGRGIVLTLAACKAADKNQNIRCHKDEHKGGFNARGIDTDVVVLFLREKGLPNAGESHWLTQVFSGEPYDRNRPLKTKPHEVGQLVPDLVCGLEEAASEGAARSVARIILARLIEERNKGRVPLTKPKGLTISKVIDLLKRHFSFRYKGGAPRLPQLAVYAIYECLLETCLRYDGSELVPLERLKAANRKTGTVGDVDILLNGRTVEAVEIKFGMPVTARHVSDAIEKIKAEDVKRYYIISTDGVKEDETAEISQACQSFYRSNGCELIVNGIYETLAYYLRLIGSTDEFVAHYVDLLAKDDDLDYVHRIAWNEITGATG